MSMTQKEIFINYDNVRRQIKELNLIADEYETVISDLRNSVNRTYGFWEGEAAEAYRMNLQNHIKELQKMK